MMFTKNCWPNLEIQNVEQGCEYNGVGVDGMAGDFG